MLKKDDLVKQMIDYVVNVLEEKRPEFSGFSVCPFVKSDRVADELHLDIFDNTKDTLLDVFKRFKQSGKRSALVAQVNENIESHETDMYQDFINCVLQESGNSNIAALCFNPNDKLEIDSYNPRSRAPCFLINMAYTKHLSAAHNSLLRTNYYDKMPKKYTDYLRITKKLNKSENTN